MVDPDFTVRRGREGGGGGNVGMGGLGGGRVKCYRLKTVSTYFLTRYSLRASSRAQGTK